MTMPRRPSTIFMIFSSETKWQTKVKLLAEHSWEGGTKVCINDPGHMAKMAAIAINSKTFKTIYSQNQKSYDFETKFEASGNRVLQS